VVFEDEASKGTDAVLERLLEDEARVPSLWTFEVTNVLVVAERRGRINESQAARFLDLLTQLPIRVDVPPVDATSLLSAGRRHGLTTYVSAYLVLAERLGAPLATMDRELATACRKAGVEVIVAG
jgi:predicted nucleic acid-binding protein